MQDIEDDFVALAKKILAHANSSEWQRSLARQVLENHLKFLQTGREVNSFAGFALQEPPE